MKPPRSYETTDIRFTLGFHNTIVFGETDGIPLQWRFDWQSDDEDAVSTQCLSWGLTKTQADPLLRAAVHDGHVKSPAHDHKVFSGRSHRGLKFIL